MNRRPIHRVLAVSAIPVLLLAGCGDDETASPSAAAPNSGSGSDWTFTDDRGVEVALSEPPDRIVAYENAAAALIPLGVRPVGVFGGSAPEDSSHPQCDYGA